MIKEGWLLLFIVLAITGITAIYAKRIHAADDDIDKTERALSALKPLLNPGSTVSYQSINVPNEVGFWVKYALAPVYISRKVALTDTTLTVCTVDVSDSVITAYRASRKLIGQNNNGQYAFLLTCSK